MKSKTRAQIRDKFNEVTNDAQGTSRRIEIFLDAFSEFLTGMEAEGFPAMLSMHETPHPAAYDLATTREGPCVHVTGTLQLRDAQRLFVIAQRDDGEPYAALSYEDPRLYNLPEQTPSFQEFSIGGNFSDEEFENLQDKIINLYAAQRTIDSTDTYKAFGPKTKHSHKPE